MYGMSLRYQRGQYEGHPFYLGEHVSWLQLRSVFS